MNNPKIDIVSFPTGFDNAGRAILPPPPKHRSKEIGWKEEVKPDLVVLCTGYRQDWSWLGEGYPKGPDECDVRGVCSSTDPSIAFIGFLRPGVGESLSAFPRSLFHICLSPLLLDLVPLYAFPLCTLVHRVLSVRNSRHCI